MNPKIVIRSETDADVSAISEVTVSAFKTLEISNHTEQFIIAAMAEFERELIRERVRAGLENAKKKGKRLGRKPVAPIDVEKVLEWHKKDPTLSVRNIAKKTKLSKSFVGKVLKENR